MLPYTECVQITRIKILVCGDRGVGKTALIHAFRDDYFTEDPEETDEMVCKIHYIEDRRVLFQMVELHIGRMLPDEAHNADAIMLLFDDESPPTIRRIQEYSFDPAIGTMLKNFMHAIRYLECSAKQMNGVKYVFFEILTALRPEHPSREQDDCNLAMTPTQAMAAVANNVLVRSGPLLRQALVNARECLMNPAAFPDVKQSLDNFLPFKIFGAAPTPEHSNTDILKKSKDGKQEDEEK